VTNFSWYYSFCTQKTVCI